MITPTRRVASRCLGEQVCDYAAGAMPVAEMLAWDRHLVACELCRQQVNQERRTMEALRAVRPVMPGDLRSILLSLASAPVPSPPPAPISVRLAVRRSPVTSPVRVLSPAAPACHRSALRAAVFAALAAGASAAAAWSMTMTTATPLLDQTTAHPTPGTQPVRQSGSGFAPAPGVAFASVSAVLSRPVSTPSASPSPGAAAAAFVTPRARMDSAGWAQSTP